VVRSLTPPVLATSAVSDFGAKRQRFDYTHAHQCDDVGFVARRGAAAAREAVISGAFGLGRAVTVGFANEISGESSTDRDA
jgi:hypothetical protein